MKQKTARITLAGLLVCLAFVLSWLESLIPAFIAIPGVKPGFANIVTVFALFKLRTRDAVFITTVRVILAGFAFSGLFASLYALCGGLTALIVMYFAKKLGCFGITGTSILGGVFHNVGQIVLAAFFTETSILLYYMPILFLSGILCGALVGLLSATAVKRIKLPDYY